MSQNYSKIRQIPILQVTDLLGLQVVKSGHGCYNVKATPDNPDDPKGFTSLCLFETSNSFTRWSGKQFGGTSKGSPIDLVMHVRDCDLTTATEWLSASFPYYLS